MFTGSLPSIDALPKPVSDLYRNLQKKGEDYLANFHRLLKIKPINEILIINFLSKTPDVLMLIKLSLIDRELAKWCEDARLAAFWNKIWKLASPNTASEQSQNTEQKSVFQGLRPQKNISSYKLLCGTTLYNEAQQLVDNNFPKESEPVIKLLIQSCELGCYDALNALKNINLAKLFKEELANPEQILVPLFNAAQWHGTPVFLLCALSYLYIGQYYYQQENMINGQQSFQSAFCFLHVAELFEETSADEIYNAYHGQGIKKSNPWEIATIAQLKNKLIEYSGLDTISRSFALLTAGRIAQQLHNDFSTKYNFQR